MYQDGRNRLTDVFWTDVHTRCTWSIPRLGPPPRRDKLLHMWEGAGYAGWCPSPVPGLHTYVECIHMCMEKRAGRLLRAGDAWYRWGGPFFRNVVLKLMLYFIPGVADWAGRFQGNGEARRQGMRGWGVHVTFTGKWEGRRGVWRTNGWEIWV